MIKNFILKRIIPLLIIIYGVMYLVNYLDISPESKAIKKTLPNDIAVTVK
jgi:hypothetical protein